MSLDKFAHLFICKYKNCGYLHLVLTHYNYMYVIHAHHVVVVVVVAAAVDIFVLVMFVPFGTTPGVWIVDVCNIYF